MEVLRSIDIRQKELKSSAYCGRVGFDKDKNGLLKQSKDLVRWSKLFCLHPPPRQPRSQRKNVCDKKGFCAGK